ncbi:MAG: hypothetical protein AAF630_00035 [Cyanobacteria bacterium P01_C01_bin.38]
MSDYEITVNLFIHLLKTQPSLFSEEDRITLMELIQKQANDIESLSDAISGWCFEHPEVDEALAKFEEVGEKAPGGKLLSTDIPKYKLDKEYIINFVKQDLS